jgi:hypothetical protein
MKKIIFMLLLTSCFYGIAFANTGKNKLRSKTSVQNVTKKKVVQIIKNVAEVDKKGNVAKPNTWQCYYFEVYGCCGLNGWACADSYASAVAMIESLIQSFCPTCDCQP